MDTVLRHVSEGGVSADGIADQCCGGSVSRRGSDRAVPLGYEGTETTPSEPVSISQGESPEHHMSLSLLLSGSSYILFISTWKSESLTDTKMCV